MVGDASERLFFGNGVVRGDPCIGALRREDPRHNLHIFFCGKSMFFDKAGKPDKPHDAAVKATSQCPGALNFVGRVLKAQNFFAISSDIDISIVVGTGCNSKCRPSTPYYTIPRIEGITSDVVSAQTAPSPESLPRSLEANLCKRSPLNSTKI